MFGINIVGLVSIQGQQGCSLTSGNSKLRNHLSKSGSLLMTRPLELKSKRATGAFSPMELAKHHGVGAGGIGNGILYSFYPGW